MGRSPRRAGLARAAALASAAAAGAALVSLLFGLGAASPAAAAEWARPFRLAGPATLDVIPAQIAFSAAGAVAVGYGVQDEDNPASSNAFAIERPARGRRFRSRQIRGAQQVLALAYEGAHVAMLTGSSPKSEPCCSSVSAVRSEKRVRSGSPQTLLSGLAGATVARLVAQPTGLLAAFATEHGVWVAQSPAAKRFAATHRLTSTSSLPESLDAAGLPHGQSIVVWTARPNRTTAGPTTISAARGTPKAAPRAARVVVAVPSGHRIDELAVAPGPAAPTIAWTESWFDGAGGYHSQTVVSDLRRGARAEPLSAPDALASGLSFAGNAHGDQAIAWKECAVTGDCAVRAVLRPAHRQISASAQLPGIDASQSPSVAVSSKGRTVLAWIQLGHVLAAQASPRAGGFGPVQVVSGTGFAADLTLAFGVGAQALAVWTQGTLNQSLVGAVFSSG